LGETSSWKGEKQGFGYDTSVKKTYWPVTRLADMTNKLYKIEQLTM